MIKHPLSTIFLIGVALFLALRTSVCHAETALEAIVRESKNPIVKRNIGAPLLNKNERSTKETKSKELISTEAIVKLQSSDRPKLEQRIDEIVVEAQREPEDAVPAKKPAFQKMKEKLDGVGKSVGLAVVETSSNGGTRTAVFKRNGQCYSIKNNAGKMNNDGSLGSAGRDAMTCSPIEAAAK